MTTDNLVFIAIMGALFLYVLQALIKSLRLVPAQVEFIVERFGRYHVTLQAGFHFLIPFVDKVAYARDLKEHTMDVPSQTCFTKDEIQVEVDGLQRFTVCLPQYRKVGHILNGISLRVPFFNGIHLFN